MAYVVKPAKEKDEFDSLLERSTLRRTLRVLAWINRFIHNSRGHAKRAGPLDTEEIETAKFWWIKRIQIRDTAEPLSNETSSQLGLRSDARGVTVRSRGKNSRKPSNLSAPRSGIHLQVGPTGSLRNASWW